MADGLERRSWAPRGRAGSPLRRAALAARAEDGFTLIEMLVVIVILGIVLAPLTTAFITSSNAEARLNRRFQAQQQARMALDKLRADLHCASAAQAQTIGTYPGIKLSVGNCYSTTPTVSWCVVPVTTSPARYQLWRSTATSSICTSSDTTRLLVADYLTGTSVFSTSTIPYQGLQTVSVDLPVNVQPSDSQASYELKDAIVAANSTRCSTSAGCAVPTVS